MCYLLCNDFFKEAIFHLCIAVLAVTSVTMATLNIKIETELKTAFMGDAYAVHGIQYTLTIS